jgi:DNA-binding GntR family transcriptional regulator
MKTAGKMREEDTPYTSLAEQAYQVLEERIVTLQLPPGAILSEQKLTQELKIGRSPVREALQRLAYEGLVVILPRRGILVSEINAGSHRRLLVVRRQLEKLMLRCACDLASEVQRQEFLQLAKEFEHAAKTGDMKSFMKIDVRFNTLLLESANNEFIEKTVRLMSGLTRRFWFKFCNIADQSKCARLHARIARAVGENNVEKSTEALNSLIDYLEKLTLKTLQMR